VTGAGPAVRVATQATPAAAPRPRARKTCPMSAGPRPVLGPRQASSCTSAKNGTVISSV
jgi:hypothetical protein